MFKILAKLTAIVCVTGIIGGKVWLIERQHHAIDHQLAAQTLAPTDTQPVTEGIATVGPKDQ